MGSVVDIGVGKLVAATIDGGSAKDYQLFANGVVLVDILGIHDGVRPFVAAEVISRCYDAARAHGAAIPVMPVTDTLRHIDSATTGHNVLRTDYRIVQTPQVFDIALLKRAFTQPFREEFTDDASVVEAMGCSVEMVEGNRENIKITTPFDLKIAETLC